MKRILFVLALMLILTVCFVGEAFALNRPWTETDNGDNGDDYPWGGDQSTEDPPPVSTKSGSYITYSTGYVAVDILFRYIFLDNINLIENVTLEKQNSSIQRIEYKKYSTVSREGIRK